MQARPAKQREWFFDVDQLPPGSFAQARTSMLARTDVIGALTCSVTAAVLGSALLDSYGADVLLRHIDVLSGDVC